MLNHEWFLHTRNQALMCTGIFKFLNIKHKIISLNQQFQSLALSLSLTVFSLSLSLSFYVFIVLSLSLSLSLSFSLPLSLSLSFSFCVLIVHPFFLSPFFLSLSLCQTGRTTLLLSCLTCQFSGPITYW